MANLGDTLSRKRRGGSGLLLLALLIVLLLVPLWRHRGVDHPLAGRVRLDACTLLSPLPPPLAALKTRPGIDNCDLLDASGVPVLSAGFSSNRSIAGGSNHGTAQAYATWIKEVRASGATEVQEQTGPWKAATSYQLGQSHQVLIEDGGLLVSLASSSMATPDLLEVAGKLMPALRER